MTPRSTGFRLQVPYRAFAMAALCLAALCAACGKETPVGPEPLPSGVVNPVMHAFLSKARSAHHLADLAEASHDRKKAIDALTEVTEGLRPPVTPEVAEVLADTYARLADLRSQEGDTDGALLDIDRGLALATEPSNFRGHLFEMRGVVEERHGKALEKRGDMPGAAAANERAKEAFEQAIDVQEQTIFRAIGSGTPASPPR